MPSNSDIHIAIKAQNKNLNSVDLVFACDAIYSIYLTRDISEDEHIQIRERLEEIQNEVWEKNINLTKEQYDIIYQYLRQFDIYLLRHSRGAEPYHYDSFEIIKHWPRTLPIYINTAELRTYSGVTKQVNPTKRRTF
jgi:hypothetical protein